jgi:hypothetical protein
VSKDGRSGRGYPFTRYAVLDTRKALEE